MLGIDDQHFKSPFQFEQEDFTMITLDHSTNKINNQSNTTVTSNQKIGQQINHGYTGTLLLNDQLNQKDSKINQSQGQLNEDGDPPLLEDIGIDLQVIKNRVILVLELKGNAQITKYPDLSGPMLIAFILGGLLLLGGKVHFGDIYAMFIMGSMLLYVLFNCMSQKQILSLYATMSSLGYCLIPMLTLAFIQIFTSLQAHLGILVSLGVAVWSSIACSNFICGILEFQQSKKTLVRLPLFLFYLSFAIIVIF